MSGVIFLIQGEKLVELREEPYDSEALLQKLLADYPKILAGDQINKDNPRRWLLIAREMGVPDSEDSSDRWSIDHLFIDQDGIPTFIEVKRSTDTRIRREVVAQMLDYAANGTEYWKVPEIKVRFEQKCMGVGKNPVDVIQQALGGAIEYEKIWVAFESNLKIGKIRLLFVADEIPKELRRIVEFLNEKMEDVEVLAIEVKQFNGENVKTLVPRVVGQTTQGELIKNPGQTRSWDEKSFLEELGKVSQEDAKVAKNLLEWAKRNTSRIWWGKGSQSGSFFPMIDLSTRSYQIFSVWTYGKVEIGFQWLSQYPQFAGSDKLVTFLQMLNSIKGVKIPENSLNRRPSFELSILHNDENYSKFINAIDWVVKEIRAN